MDLNNDRCVNCDICLAIRHFVVGAIVMSPDEYFYIVRHGTCLSKERNQVGFDRGIIGLQL